MLERTDAITNEVLEPITFVLTYPTVFKSEVTEKYVLKCWWSQKWPKHVAEE